MPNPAEPGYYVVGSERQEDELQSTQPSEREAIRKIDQLGSSSCWPLGHPKRPLAQTLRWSSDKAPYKQKVLCYVFNCSQSFRQVACALPGSSLASLFNATER